MVYKFIDWLTTCKSRLKQIGVRAGPSEKKRIACQLLVISRLIFDFVLYSLLCYPLLDGVQVSYVITRQAYIAVNWGLCIEKQNWLILLTTMCLFKNHFILTQYFCDIG